jgi:tetratricopeptide (TPR) repeat protein
MSMDNFQYDLPFEYGNHNTPTAQSMSISTMSFQNTLRTTVCDIMCIINTKDVYVLPSHQKSVSDKVTRKDTSSSGATLPFKKTTRIVGNADKGSTPFQKLKLAETKVVTNNQFHEERDHFFAEINEGRIQREILETESTTKIQAHFRGLRRRIKINKRPNYVKPVKKVSNFSVLQLHDDLCYLASIVSLKPIPGLTLESKGRASRRKAKIEHAAVLRLQIWSRMLFAKSEAQSYMAIYKAKRREKSSRIISRFFRLLKLKSFKKRVGIINRARGIIKIQNAARFFLYYRRKRLREKLKHRAARNQEAAIIIQRQALTYVKPNLLHLKHLEEISRIEKIVHETTRESVDKVINNIFDSELHKSCSIYLQELYEEEMARKRLEQQQREVEELAAARAKLEADMKRMEEEAKETERLRIEEEERIRVSKLVETKLKEEKEKEEKEKAEKEKAEKEKEESEKEKEVPVDETAVVAVDEIKETIAPKDPESSQSNAIIKTLASDIVSDCTTAILSGMVTSVNAEDAGTDNSNAILEETTRVNNPIRPNILAEVSKEINLAMKSRVDGLLLKALNLLQATQKNFTESIKESNSTLDSNSTFLLSMLNLAEGEVLIQIADYSAATNLLVLAIDIMEKTGIEDLLKTDISKILPSSFKTNIKTLIVYSKLLQLRCDLFIANGLFIKAETSLNKSDNLCELLDKILDFGNTVPPVTPDQVNRATTSDGLNNKKVVAKLRNNSLKYKSRIMFKKGNYSNAQSLYQELVDSQRVLYGPETLKVAESLEYLTKILVIRGDYGNAIKYAELGLNIRVKLLPENCSDIAISKYLISQCMIGLGEYDEALKLAITATVMIKASQNNEVNDSERGHPNVANCYNGLGNVQSSLGLYDDALKSYNAALDIQIYLYKSLATEGSNISLSNIFESNSIIPHQDIFTSMFCIGKNTMLNGKHKEAIVIFNKALAIVDLIKINLVVESHYDEELCKLYLAKCYCLDEQIEKGKEILENNLIFMVNLFGKNHVIIAEWLKIIGLISKLENNNMVSKFFYEKSLDMKLFLLNYELKEKHPEILLIKSEMSWINEDTTDSQEHGNLPKTKQMIWYENLHNSNDVELDNFSFCELDNSNNQFANSLDGLSLFTGSVDSL